MAPPGTAGRIETHEPITVPELATASGMSQRPLELAFQESLH